MKKLVLLQTADARGFRDQARDEVGARGPHAARRVPESSSRSGRAKMKATLLNEGATFEKPLDLARQWEATGPATAMRGEGAAEAAMATK